MEAKKIDKKQLKKLLGEGYNVTRISQMTGFSVPVLCGHIANMSISGEICMAKIKKARLALSAFNPDVIRNKNRRVVKEEWNYKPLGNGVTLEHIKSSQCHFPCSRGVYCGANAVYKHGYCQEHHDIVYAGKGARL